MKYISILNSRSSRGTTTPLIFYDIMNHKYIFIPSSKQPNNMHKYKCTNFTSFSGDLIESKEHCKVEEVGGDDSVDVNLEGNPITKCPCYYRPFVAHLVLRE